MANVIYTGGITKWSLFADAATPSGMTIKVALMKSSYTADKDHNTMAEINTHEVQDTIGASYERQILENQIESVDNTLNRVKYDADDVIFETLTTDDPVAGIVIYVDENPAAPDDSNTQLLAFFEIPERQPNGTNFQIAWSSDGIVTAQQG